MNKHTAEGTDRPRRKHGQVAIKSVKSIEEALRDAKRNGADEWRTDLAKGRGRGSLRIRARPNGHAIWYFRYIDANGKQQPLRIGVYDPTGRAGLTLQGAREKAGELSKLYQGGVRDLHMYLEQQQAEERAERETIRSGATVADMLKASVEDSGSRKRALKARTKADYLRMIQPAERGASGRKRVAGELHAIADKPIASLTGPEVKGLYASLQKRGATRAAYAMRVLRATLRYAGVKLDVDPFDRAAAGKDRIILPSPGTRDRLIPKERLSDWWKAADAAKSGDYFQFLALTGLRRGEASALKVGDVDLVGGRVRVRDTKNHKPHVVHLSVQARAIVERRVKGRKRDELVFDGAGDPRKTLRAIVDTTGIEFSAHDCRRTFATIAAANLPAYTVKALLNHAPGNDVTSVYVHPTEETLREGWQKVADLITPLAPEVDPAAVGGNVVPIRQTA